MFDAPPRKTNATPTFAILGAGVSGLAMAVKLREAGVETFTIYEKADEVGGTWRENTYPGVACDVPSHLYSYSFELNPNWSKRFSPGSEIQDYIKACASKHDLYRSIQFGKEVTEAVWQSDHWQVAFADGSVIKADYVISALGGLHEPSIPDFAGREAFEGPVFHSAQWRHDVDLAGKRVAIIGSAASAVQIIPEIVDNVAHLDVYQRTANWIMSRPDYGYPRWLRSAFKRFPVIARAYRGAYYYLLESRFAAFRQNESWIKRQVQRNFTRFLEKSVPDPALRAKLTPDYPPGCKRMLFSNTYYSALQRDHVDLVTDPIERFSAGGIVTNDGAEHPADVVVLATGFRTWNIAESVTIKGERGVSLGDAWRNGIRAHRTIAEPGFPNFFMLLGPNSGLGHNSVILMIEAEVKYIIRLIEAARAKNASIVEPTKEAFEAFNGDIQAELADRVWASACGSWYRDQETGLNYTLYPHPVRNFERSMATVDLAEYDYR